MVEICYIGNTYSNFINFNILRIIIYIKIFILFKKIEKISFIIKCKYSKNEYITVYSNFRTYNKRTKTEKR